MKDVSARNKHFSEMSKAEYHGVAFQGRQCRLFILFQDAGNSFQSSQSLRGALRKM